MENATIDDLFFYANALNEALQPKEAINMMKILIEKQPSLNLNQRSLFASISKAIVDPIRGSLCVLTEEEKTALVEYLSKIQLYREECFSKLFSFSQEIIRIVDDMLLPHSRNQEEITFYLKLKGDFSRYISEFSSDSTKEKYLKEANDSYLEATKKAESLEFSSSTRLGTILNYSVFLYEHMNDFDGAISLLKNTLERVKRQYPNQQVSLDEETIDIVKVMTRNLENWLQETYEEEEEENQPKE